MKSEIKDSFEIIKKNYFNNLKNNDSKYNFVGLKSMTKLLKNIVDNEMPKDDKLLKEINDFLNNLKE